MSVPRPIIPGVTRMVSRRCFDRRFLLRPSLRTVQIFKFCLAVAAEKTGVLIHAYCVMSNHYHIVLTDVLGNLPVFMHWLNEYVAKCMNVELGRWESFWAPGSYSSVAALDPESVLKRLEYTYVNPVDAGLVRSPKHWPGAISSPDDIGGPGEIIERPEGFFREDGPVPERACLKLVPPPVFNDDGSWLRDLKSRVAARVAEIRARFKREQRCFLGRKKVLRQSPLGRPSSVEPRRGLNPRIASRDKWRRIEALGRLKGFLDDYRAAWKAFADGNREVFFPYGTYAMRVRFGVNCQGP